MHEPKHYGVLDADMRVHRDTALHALQINDGELMCAALKSITATDHPARALLTAEFLEGFVCVALTTPSGQTMLLRAMEAARFGRHALPILLAAKCVVENSGHLIPQLMPEIVKATQILFERITEGMQK